MIFLLNIKSISSLIFYGVKYVKKLLALSFEVLNICKFIRYQRKKTQNTYLINELFLNASKGSGYCKQ